MTTDKPGEAAMLAAQAIMRCVRGGIAETELPGLPEEPTQEQVELAGKLVQIAIDRETAAVEAERDEALATIQRNLEISTATEALLLETAEERDEARAAVRGLGNALELVMPLARGYAPEGQTETAKATCRSWVASGEDALTEYAASCWPRRRARE